MMSSEKLRPVGLLWLGEPLSAYELLSLSSFARAGHPVHLYTYDDFRSLPSDIQRHDARDVLPEESVFRNSDRPYSFALYADWFRYQMIRSTGFVWADADMVCLRALPDRDPLFAWSGRDRINNALLYASPSSRLISELVRGAESLADPNAREVPWGTFGPRLLTEVVEELGMQQHALAVELVHPISAPQLWRMFDPRCIDWCRERTDGALTLHLWNSKLQKAGVKLLAPPAGSFLEELMLAHEIPLPSERIPIGLVRTMRGHKEVGKGGRTSLSTLWFQDIARQLRRRTGLRPSS